MGYVLHKDRNKPPTASRGKILKLLCASLTLFLVPILLSVIDPVVIIAKYMTRITNGSELHHLLLQELDIIHLSTYLYNVTNKERFISGEDAKLKVEEVGPFTYKEMRLNEDMEIDPNDGVMRYTPHVWTEFMPEASVAHPENVHIVMPNIALLSLTHLVSDYPSWTRLGYHMLLQRSGSHSFVEMDAQGYMWGYDEPIVKFGNTFMPGWISFDTMGFLDRMYDKKLRYRVEVGNTNADKFEIKSYDGHHGLTMWNYDEPETRSKCNSFENAYEGIAFPPELTPDRPLRVYRTVLCRILNLDYVGKKTMYYGGEAFTYKLNNKTFSKNQDNDCLCQHGVCSDGYSDISPCFYGLPFTLSNAHFYGADPELYSRVEGIKPDPAKDDSIFILDPITGAVVHTKFALQLNIVLRDVDFNRETKSFSNMVVPIAYFIIETPGLKEEQKAHMKLMYNTGPKVLLAIQIVTSLIALLLLSCSMRLLYWNWFCTDGKGIAFQVPTDIKNASGVPLVGYDDT